MYGEGGNGEQTPPSPTSRDHLPLVSRGLHFVCLSGETAKELFLNIDCHGLRLRNDDGVKLNK